MGKDLTVAKKRLETNLPAKKYQKGSPAQIRLSFEVPAGRVTQFVDIASALSAINRKAYRQGVYYYVNSVEMYDNGVQTTNLHVIPDTWMTRAAYRRAKGLYEEMSMPIVTGKHLGGMPFY